jgi:Uma2 family endonuclease
MAIPNSISYITVAEYLESEKISDVRHEYIDGEVYAMAGESRRHNRIAFNMARQFENHLENTNCETYFEGVKIRASSATYYYPDVVVTCETENEDEEYILKFPRLIVEVFSPSTAATDKREKLIAYKFIESLHEYAIVWQDEKRVELHRRKNDGWLIFFFLHDADEVEFDSIGLKTTVAEIYRNIVFEQ